MNFSTGKDSLATWLFALKHGVRVIPVFRYLIPGLAWVERVLDHYAQKFSVPGFERAPTATFFRLLQQGVYCRPWSIPFNCEEENPLHAQILSEVVEKLGLPPDTPILNGVRAADSIRRRLRFMQMGPEHQHVSLIWDWNKEQTLEIIRQAGIDLPVDYRMFGRSFDGLRGPYLMAIRDRFPEDYQVIKSWFPFVDVEVWRYERFQIHVKPKSVPKGFQCAVGSR